MLSGVLQLAGRRGAQRAALAARALSAPSAQSRSIAAYAGALAPSSGTAFSASPAFRPRALAPPTRGISSSPAALKSVTVDVPSMGESVTEGTVASIVIPVGGEVTEDAVLAQLDTDKVSLDIKYTSKTPGVVREYKFAEGDSVRVGDIFAVVEEGGSGKPAAKKKEAAPAAPAKEAPAKAEAPKVEAPKAPKAATAPAPAAAAAAAPSPRGERRVKMTRLRARVAERLKSAQNTYAMLSTFNEVDMTNIMALRKAHKDAFAEKHGVKLGFMSAFVKAAASALKAVPAVNGVIDGDDILYRDYCDISVAVSTPKGLVVPVLRDADGLSFADVEKNINALGKKARDGTLSMDDMAGGTFTISNGGVFGSLLSTPIINPPQSAILGMHATNMRPMVVDGAVVPRPMMYIALTYDHRLIDGREAVAFLKHVKDAVEDPRKMLLDL